MQVDSADAWQPPSGKVWLEIGHGSRRKYGPYQADAFGFVRFPFMPQFFQVRWNFRVWGPRGKTTLAYELKTEGYQVVMELPAPIVPAESAVPIRVETLQGRGVVHLDLVQHGQRIWSQKAKIHDGKSKFLLKLPKGLQGLCSVQVYTEFYFPGEVYDTRLLWVGGLRDKAPLLKTLRRHLVHRGDGMRILEIEKFARRKVPSAQLRPWVEHLFAIAKARFVAPELFFDSSKQRQTQLRSFQGTFRNATLFFLGGLGGVVLVGMFGWMFWGYRRDQRLIRDAAEQGVGELESRGFFIIILALLVLALIFATILYLFWAMKWTYDFL